MPLTVKINSDNQYLGIWKIEEPSSQLLNMVHLSEQEEEKYQIFKLESRKQEWLAVRALIQTHLGNHVTTSYNQIGQPILIKSSYNIGISHTKGYASVILNKNKAVALDIERSGPRILKVSDRFINDHEKSISHNLSDEIYQTIIWSAKETMFKWWGETEVVFKDQLHILSINQISSNQYTLKSTLTKNNESIDLPLQCCIKDEYVLVYTA